MEIIVCRLFFNGSVNDYRLSPPITREP
uniref:Uncharacterized protein n=1 Tax=Anguilla anguilla TaxID=7936 RepID=A0A0E9SW05_ANGAN